MLNLTSKHVYLEKAVAIVQAHSLAWAKDRKEFKIYAIGYEFFSQNKFNCKNCRNLSYNWKAGLDKLCYIYWIKQDWMYYKGIYAAKEPKEA